MAEEVGPYGEMVFRQGSGADCVIALRPGQALGGGGGAVFGIAAAVGQCTDFIARLPPSGVVHCRYFAGDLEAEQWAGTRGRRIEAEALLHVGTVDAGGHDTDEQLTWRWVRDWAGGDLHGIRPAGGVGDLAHLGRDWHGCGSFAFAEGSAPNLALSIWLNEPGCYIGKKSLL